MQPGVGILMDESPDQTERNGRLGAEGEGPIGFDRANIGISKEILESERAQFDSNLRWLENPYE